MVAGTSLAAIISIGLVAQARYQSGKRGSGGPRQSDDNYCGTTQLLGELLLLSLTPQDCRLDVMVRSELRTSSQGAVTTPHIGGGGGSLSDAAEA